MISFLAGGPRTDSRDKQFRFRSDFIRPLLVSLLATTRMGSHDLHIDSKSGKMRFVLRLFTLESNLNFILCAFLFHPLVCPLVFKLSDALACVSCSCSSCSLSAVCSPTLRCPAAAFGTTPREGARLSGMFDQPGKNPEVAPVRSDRHPPDFSKSNGLRRNHHHSRDLSASAP